MEMANQEHLEILAHGVPAWNQWREREERTIPDLRRMEMWGGNLARGNFSNADLSGANLSEVNFSDADFSRASLVEARLNKCGFSGARFIAADLRKAQLRRAELMLASMIQTNLKQADLVGADLVFVDMNGADLSDADLAETNLLRTNLSNVNLFNTNLNKCSIGETNFGNVDLRKVKGLETITHIRQSSVGIDTIYLSHREIPLDFLRGCGFPENFIESLPALLQGPIEYSSCFISYSSKDQEFAERLHADLQTKGVRCWFAPEDLKIGQRLRPSFDEAIRLHDKLMVIISEHSVSSIWVEKEVETAFDKERQQNRTVLFPIRLDDAVMEAQASWAADIRRTRHIGDFRDWKDHTSYKRSFDRLLRDLRSEVKLV